MDGQFLPPFSGILTILFMRNLWPPLHFSEHGLHSPQFSEATQSMGHGKCTLQDLEKERLPQAAPDAVGAAMIDRVFDWEPPGPQDLTKSSHRGA